MATSTERAVLLVGHGTISDLADVPEFLRRIRRGRPATDALIEEIRRRYAVIGRSPLLDTTEALARGLESRLGMPVRVAMRFWSPLIEEVLSPLIAGEIRELCILPVAPFSVHVYAGVVSEAADRIVAEGGQPHRSIPVLRSVTPYGADPLLVAAQAAKVAPLLAGKDPASTELVLTAHSLPTRAIASGDPYQGLFEESANAIATALGWPVTIAYQSQGADGGEWLGPTLEATLKDVHARGKCDVVVAPVGFLADHVETLYDLDVEARQWAAALGLGFARSPALGSEPALVEALAHVVRRAFQ